MAIYLKEFENHTQYENYINGSDAILPNVSICTTEGDVHYNPYVDDPYAGHEYVEIGGLKWATMNIGANSPTDAGLYFQWGDTIGYTSSQVGSGSDKKYFGWTDYKYGNGTSSPYATDMTKYNSTDGKTVLDVLDDAARANWGGQWRMPTTEEFVALGAATTTAWTTSYQGSGVSGLVFTSKADNSVKLFFPAVGSCGNGGTYDMSRGVGNYWLNSLYTSDNLRANALYFLRDSTLYYDDISQRFYGYPVRGVVGE